MQLSATPPPAPLPPPQHISERWSGDVSRTLRLPRNADFASIESRLESGVLSITVRKAAGTAKHGRRKVAVA